MREDGELAEAVTYALQVADGYLAQLSSRGRDPEGLSILELGPGRDFGPALVLAGLGARVTVADRFLQSWDPSWHPAFYAALRDALVLERTDLPSAAVQRVCARAGYEGVLGTISAPVERLGPKCGLYRGTIDVCFSNAVLEHVARLGPTCARLAEITAPGGLGFHQVDFRDHRDFDRPLEHLTMGPWRYRWMRWRQKGACGSAWRPDDLQTQFRSAGFEVDGFEVNLRADEAYLDDVQPRCRKPWRGLSRDELAVLSGRFSLRRLDASGR